ncbi:hypothetical protein NLI96_g6437 [Meripilus lineatus]|uniref:BTB domain-containing protein n=1 Tax=Meripilus lineatus TaxID=2056292 RepID=A0AAD5V0Y0_9APHY|nr:hypothetical protein NLI96_g6437 [Physisporinus lineatus]
MPALPPFDRPDATLIIRSSDFIDFRLHKEALILASSHFERILKTPPVSLSVDSLPQYDVPEDSETLDYLFRFIYPIGKPLIWDLRVVGKVIKAALKYEMKEVEMEMRDHLERLSADDPVTAYAIACQLNFEEEASVAANHAIGKEGLQYVSELDDIAAGPYFRFLQFISAKVPVYNEEEPDMGPNFSPAPQTLFITPPEPEGNRSSNGCKYEVFDPATVVSSQYPPDIILQSSDDVQVKAHRIFLMMTSCIFSGLLHGVPRPRPNADALPVISLDVPGRLLSRLVSLCYPLSEPSMDTIDDLVELVDVALKFELKAVHNLARKRIMKLEETETDPLRIYYICIRFKWYDEAQLLAQKMTMLATVEKYYPEMEFVPSWAYFNLRRYHARCSVMLGDLLLANGRKLYSTSRPCCVGFIEEYEGVGEHRRAMEVVARSAIKDERLRVGDSEFIRPSPSYDD